MQSNYFFVTIRNAFISIRSLNCGTAITGSHALLRLDKKGAIETTRKPQWKPHEKNNSAVH